MNRLALLLPMLLVLTAASLPQPTAGSTHIQIVRYDPDVVVQLTGAPGWQMMIEFAPDERLENVSIGDALAWQVTPNKRARHLFLKPLSRSASTNMTVLTDRRRYAFALASAPRKATTPWIVRFEYPRMVEEAIDEPLPPPPPPLNFAYTSAGHDALFPARVWDDGRLTYFEFAPGVPIPAIFANGPGKDEALVNVSARGRVTVVQQTAGRFTLRVGKQVATVTASVVTAGGSR